ncbi:MAG TPA: squalene/phytoene synthase family protein [Terriglobia bacterium]|nr:squalene/phytoene synthase family protein [Terriglobia bacterium]
MPSAPKHFTDSRTTNFYYSFLFLPQEKRRAIEAVYLFARRSDDAADDQRNPEAAAREIARYRVILDQCFEQNGALPPNLDALREAIHRFQIPRQPFDDLLLGLEMDLHMDQTGGLYKTFSELELYCYRVASTIGLIAIEIFGYSNPQTRQYAISLGKALQMVNILRDIESDAKRGRVYLPEEDMARFGVDPAALRQVCYNHSFRDLALFESRRAREFFEQARRLLPPEDSWSMQPAEIMGAIYWQLLRKIERQSFNVFGSRMRLSRPVKLATAIKVYLGAEWRK